MLFDTARQEIFAQLKTILTAELGSEPSSEHLVLELPPDPKMGDFAFPAFKLAKLLRKAPPQIAKLIADKLGANSELSAKVSVVPLGPYVNFAIKKEVLLHEVLNSLLMSKNALAEKTLPEQPTVILEFSSPNVAKAFNIYHLRGTMIGNCLYRIYKARGYNVIGINHLGDWGTQYGTLAVAYEMWGNDQELEKRGIEYLVELYVRINKEIESNPELVTKAREYFSKLEHGDPKIKSMWQKFVALSLKEFDRTYKRLDVHFDHYWGESYYVDKIPALEQKIKDKNLLIESEGALVVALDAFEMPPCIIRKADGSSIYATRDLAAAIYRQEKFHFSKMIYVVGGEQKLHFAQVFKTLELMGYPWAKDCTHVDFGLYRFKDAKMSTRKGNYVTMESVLDLAVERVEEIMKEKWSDKQSPWTNEQERHQAAEHIGVSAIIYNDLSTDRNTDVNFDLDRILDFEGETGPYIQYAHTRCLGILRNAPTNLLMGIDLSQLLTPEYEQKGFVALLKAAGEKIAFPEELDLIRILAKLPLILDSVLETQRPSILASYLIEVTKTFNTFYRGHKVLVEDETLAKARLALVLATQRTLFKGATLLGMKLPERM